MSRISENIRKITKAWGGKTTGNGISDALSDLYNNLPFGVKTEMVEIVPEQSVTGVLEDNYYSYETIKIPLRENYIVVFNGKHYNVKNNGGVGGICEIGEPLNNYNPAFLQYPFSISGGTNINDEINGLVMWKPDLGETITLAIYEEQEIVIPLNSKFAPGIVITQNEDYIFSANVDFETVVKMHNDGVFNSAVLKMFEGGIVLYQLCSYIYNEEENAIALEFYTNSQNALTSNVPLMFTPNGVEGMPS